MGALHGHPPVGLIYGAGALHAFIGSIDQPTRSAMAPRLVGAHLVASSVALNQVMWQTIGIVGPALAGIVIARAGYGLAYGIDLVTYGALFVAALLMRPMPPEHDPDSASGWEAVKMIFELTVTLTFLAFTQFHRGPRSRRAPVRRARGRRPRRGVDGRLDQIRAPTGTRRHLGGRGVGVCDRRVRFGGFEPSARVVLPGARRRGRRDLRDLPFDVTQVTTPDRLRGRMSQIFILVVTGGPRLGDFEAGLVAAWFTPTISVVTGGLACILGSGVVALVYPELRRYHADIAA